VPRQAVDALPEIELIAASAATETAEDLATEVDREAALLAHGSGIVNGTRSAKLLPTAADRLKAQQPQNLLHGDGGAERGVVDPGHSHRGLGGHSSREGGLASTRWAR